jgi:hypothetical protein
MVFRVSGVKYLDFVLIRLVTKSTISCDKRNKGKKAPLWIDTAGLFEFEGWATGLEPANLLIHSQALCH